MYYCVYTSDGAVFSIQVKNALLIGAAELLGQDVNFLSICVPPRRYGVDILSNSGIPVPNFMAFPFCIVYL